MPPTLQLAPFYEKYIDARGIPVVGSAGVSDLALERACDISIHVLAERADVRARMVANDLRVVVIARDEVMTDIPEYRDLYTLAPNLDWDKEARGTGPARGGIPIASAGEENLLCSSDDLFRGETLLVFALGHALRALGIVDVEPQFEARVRAAYDHAMAAGLWSDTHAGRSAEQYWAEGVQDWFDANREALPAPDGLHNAINTRAELKAYDPGLAAIVAEYVPEDAWRPRCLAQP
ncbi:MAG TPA: hypothetical protein VJV79_40830 [Polyangiaceae bacterium]|nr:hypothetical protein [Polyangiaceae bacterium]